MLINFILWNINYNYVLFTFICYQSGSSDIFWVKFCMLWCEKVFDEVLNLLFIRESFRRQSLLKKSNNLFVQCPLNMTVRVGQTNRIPTFFQCHSSSMQRYAIWVVIENNFSLIHCIYTVTAAQKARHVSLLRLYFNFHDS